MPTFSYAFVIHAVTIVGKRCQTSTSIIDPNGEFAFDSALKPVSLEQRFRLSDSLFLISLFLPRPLTMLFNSFAFWTFFAIVVLLYRRLSHRGQNRMLLVASYFFYGCWDWRFLSLIIISTIVDYFAAIRIQNSDKIGHRKGWLTLSMCTNLGILGVFKYYGFFAGELSSFFTTIGIPALLPTLNIVLPVGISFYTFQTMSYTIDVYRGEAKATRYFLDFALYVCFFPQLVAGPIERSSRFLPQVLNPRTHHADNFRIGLYHVMIGLFKKVIVADNMAVIVNTIFATPTSQLTGLECLVGVYAFAFQIYGDFSGYSSIAQGIAKWLGFDLMTNFRMPYFSVSPSDFWQRWHISLSSWLRDYLYIPLGGNRGGKWNTYRNLMLTMLLGGLWHGAGWTFIAWGFFHGALLCAYRIFEKSRTESSEQSTRGYALFIRICQTVLMFHLICIGWLLFRAESMTQVWNMLGLIATNWQSTPLAISSVAMIAFFAGPLMVYELWLEYRKNLYLLPEIHWLTRSAAYGYCLLMLLFFLPPIQNEFIYFQF